MSSQKTTNSQTDPNNSVKRLKIVKRNFVLMAVESVILFIVSISAFVYGYKLTQNPMMAVLLFHAETDMPQQSWEIPQQKLDSYIESFLANKYEPINPTDFENQLTKPTNKRSFMITFDDGFACNYESIKRIYSKYGIKSVLFMVEDFLDKPEGLTSSQLLDLQKNCGTFIGLHGKTHENLIERLASGTDIGKELEDARTNLSRICGKPIKWMSYPYGANNEEIQKTIAEKTAIDLAFTIEGGNIALTHKNLALNRYMYMGADSPNRNDPLIDNLLPPEDYRNGSLTITMSIMFFFFAISRALLALKFYKAIAILNIKL